MAATKAAMTMKWKDIPNADPAPAAGVTSVLQVPGGWVYRFVTASGVSSLMFVPDPRRASPERPVPLSNAEGAQIDKFFNVGG